MIGAVIDRLRAQAMPPLRSIGDALDLAQLQREPPAQRPAAFVVPVGGKAEPNQRVTGQHRQRLENSFAVVLCIGAEGNQRGGSADRIQAVADPVRDAVLAWQPGAGFTGCEFLGDGLMQPFGNGVVWWRLDFSTRSNLIK